MKMRPVRIPIQLITIMLVGCNMSQHAPDASKADMHFTPFESNHRIHYDPKAEDIARSVASYLPESIATVERELHGPFVKAVQVKVFENADNFAAFTGVSKQEWGVMISGTVFLSGLVKTAPDEHVKALLTHELVHLYFQQRLVATKRPRRLPMWFEEGLAEFVSGGSAMVMVSEQDATQAILTGNHFFSDDACGLIDPKRCKFGVEAHMFYRQAEMFVAYLQSLDGINFRSLILALADGEDFGDSWRSHMQISLHDAWRQFTRELESSGRVPVNKEN